MKIPRTRHLVRPVAAALVMAVAAGPAPAQEAATSTQVDPAAMTALDKMGQALRALDGFALTSDTSLEIVLDSGQKVELDGQVTYKVRKPDKLYVEIRSDRKLRELYFDGKALTVFAPRLNYYASVGTKAATLGDLVLNAAADYGIEFPLADLFYWGTDHISPDAITSALYVGPGTMDGQPVEHYAFRQEGADWQVWLTATSLPKKLVITSLDDPALPRYSAQLHWDTQTPIDAGAFAFSPPEGAARIALVPIETIAGTEEE